MNRIQPSLAEFKKLAKKGNTIPLKLDVLADRMTPVSLLASQWDASSSCFLLESVEGGENLGRYSIVGFDPELQILEKNGVTEVTDARNKKISSARESALDVLQRIMRDVKPVIVPQFPRFVGGAVGYSSYETVHGLEKLPRTKPDNLNWPTSCYYLTNDLYIFDNTQQLLKLITCVRLTNKTKLSAAYNQGVRRLKNNLARLRKAAKKDFKVYGSGKPTSGNFVSNVDKNSFCASVRKAKSHISAGDIIQVVLSRRMEKKTNAHPLNIYRTLRVVNPSPYMFLYRMKDRVLIGSSPESLVRLEDGTATTRPIAGTRPRGQTQQHDERLKAELLKDPKERAEHVMLVDLGRNDLGRVCDFGSVDVPEFLKVEYYSHVMHMVSEVQGKLKPRKNAYDLLKAAFPAGTVSGAPKIRAMEIIDELEITERGPYAGCVGYISYSGNMDMAITIRTILYDDGKIVLQAGAGIVADSIPSKEFIETENKAAALKQTILLAEKGDLFMEKS